MTNHLKVWATTFAATVGLLLGGAMTQQATHAATASGVGTVNYVGKYGINLWQKPGAQPLKKKLTNGTRWKVFAGAQGQKEYYFNLGGKQFIQSSYLDLDNETSSQSLNAVGRVNYVPGYGIAIWTKPAGGHAIAGRTLKHNTAWKVSARQVVNGRVWYELGRNQWMDGRYFKLTSEKSRGVKHYAVSPTKLLELSAKKPAAKPAPKPVVKPSGHSNSETVYLSKSGKRYHFTKSCSGLGQADKSAIRSMTLGQAKQKGYTQCHLEK